MVLIDEVQRIPELLNEVHWLLENKKNKVTFILTGSSARKLKRANANMLSGRAFVLYLFPFTVEELGNDFNLFESLQFGTLPVVLSSNDSDDKEQILRAYTDTYIREEIQQEALVRKIEAFVRFLDISAQNHSEPLNFSKIGKECRVSDNTIKDYYQILIDTMMGFYLQGWHRSIRKQVQKNPKFYYFDCGVLNSLRKELKIEISLNSKRTGKLFETFIIQEIFRINTYYQKDWSFYYWRTSLGLEVDLILQKNLYANPIAIEIKLSNSVDKSDLVSLKKFKEEEPKAHLYVFANIKNAFELEGISVLPWREGIELLISKY